MSIGILPLKPRDESQKLADVARGASQRDEDKAGRSSVRRMQHLNWSAFSAPIEGTRTNYDAYSIEGLFDIQKDHPPGLPLVSGVISDSVVPQLSVSLLSRIVKTYGARELQPRV
jgi:hypothetical protein